MYILSGLVTGFLVGLTGIGGGAIMTPILLLFFKIEPITAIATDLWFATLTKISAGVVHSHNRAVNWRIVTTLWCGSLPAVLLATHWVNASSSRYLQQAMLVPIIASVILITAISLLLTTLRSQRPVDNGSRRFSAKQQTGLAIAAGAFLGGLVALTSIGAGALGTVILLTIFRNQLTTANLIASDIVHAIPMALLAGMSYFFAGHVNVVLLGYLLIGSIPGAYLGSLCTGKFPPRLIKLSLSSVLFFSGIRLLL